MTLEPTRGRVQVQEQRVPLCRALFPWYPDQPLKSGLQRITPLSSSSFSKLPPQFGHKTIYLEHGIPAENLHNVSSETPFCGAITQWLSFVKRYQIAVQTKAGGGGGDSSPRSLKAEAKTRGTAERVRICISWNPAAELRKSGSDWSAGRPVGTWHRGHITPNSEDARLGNEEVAFPTDTPNSTLLRACPYLKIFFLDS